MKIGIISNLYPPRARGGAEIIAETMARGFSAQGHDVFVLTTTPYASIRSLRPSLADQGGVRVYAWYPFNLYHYSNGHKKPWFVRLVWHLLDILNIHSALQAKKILEEERPDIVISHNLMGIGFLIPPLLARLKLRHVHVLHDVQLYNPSGIIRLNEERSLAQMVYSAVGYPALMRFLFRKVAVMISPSHFLMDFYHRHDFFQHTQTRIIPNPVDFTEKVPHQAAQGKLRLLYVGNISETKGALGLVDTIMRLDSAAVTLTLIGDGPEVGYVQERAAESQGRISMLARVPHDALPRFFAGSDILVAPTLCYDTFPTIVAESLRCGLPVIVSDLGGAKEIVQDGINGWVVPAGQWMQLELLLKKLIAEPRSIVQAALHAEGSVAQLTVDRYIGELLRALDI